jgi:histidinol phosphatase-like PHP family hydrolase
MSSRLPRRGFLQRTAFATASLVPFLVRAQGQAAGAATPPLKVPLVDFHVHPDNSTIEKIVTLSAERGVKFGLVEHAGTKENEYPVVLSDDAGLLDWIAKLEGKGVYKGVQAEWTDWMGCFSKAALAKLDYVLTDAMTMPGKQGQRVKLWLPGAVDEMGMNEPEEFMDRYVEWHVQTMATEPFDILGNTSWLPDRLAPDWDRLWTPARMDTVIAAALKYGVALEISASYKLPRLPFLRRIKEAGVKFSLGSNGRYPNMGKLEYSLDMARTLGLETKDMFTPAPDGQTAVQRGRV